jgi:hypothetical protein
MAGGHVRNAEDVFDVHVPGEAAAGVHMGGHAELPVHVRVDMRRAGRVGVHVLVRVDVVVGGSSDDVCACAYVLALVPFRALTCSGRYAGVDVKVMQVGR